MNPMTNDTENLVLNLLKDIQMRLGRMEVTNLELRLTAQEQHLGTLVVSLSISYDHIDALTHRLEWVERRLELREKT